MSNIEWRKSSFSGADNDCVEVRVGRQATHVRDSKALGDGELGFGPDQFQGFLVMVSKFPALGFGPK
jgi:hypothetical protein